MASAIILGIFGVIVVLVAALTGTLAKVWLALFKQELHLPFGKKNENHPDA